MKGMLLVICSGYIKSFNHPENTEVLYELALSTMPKLKSEVHNLLGENMGTDQITKELSLLMADSTAAGEDNKLSDEAIWIKKYYEVALAYCDGDEQKKEELKQKLIEVCGLEMYKQLYPHSGNPIV